MKLHFCMKRLHGLKYASSRKYISLAKLFLHCVDVPAAKTNPVVDVVKLVSLVGEAYDFQAKKNSYLETPLQELLGEEVRRCYPGSVATPVHDQ